METIREAATAISFTAVILGAVSIIAPEAASNKKIKPVFALLIIIAIITPFAGERLSLPEFSAENGFYSDAGELLRTSAKHVIVETLRQEGVSFKALEISADIRQDGGISINSVYIYGADNRELTKRIINNTFTVREVVFYD